MSLPVPVSTAGSSATPLTVFKTGYTGLSVLSGTQRPRTEQVA